MGKSIHALQSRKNCPKKQFKIAFLQRYKLWDSRPHFEPVEQSYIEMQMCWFHKCFCAYLLKKFPSKAIKEYIGFAWNYTWEQNRLC